MINSVINAFLDYVRASWYIVKQFISQDTSGSLKDDWFQANWELLVEGSLSKDQLIYLEIYGDGADVHSPSSRVLLPEAETSHVVILRAKTTKPIKDYLNNEMVKLPEDGLPVDRFVTIGNDGWYYEDIPFDKVLVKGQNIKQIFDILDVDFYLEALSDEQRGR